MIRHRAGGLVLGIEAALFSSTGTLFPGHFAEGVFIVVFDFGNLRVLSNRYQELLTSSFYVWSVAMDIRRNGYAWVFELRPSQHVWFLQSGWRPLSSFPVCFVFQ